MLPRLLMPLNTSVSTTACAFHTASLLTMCLCKAVIRGKASFVKDVWETVCRMFALPFGCPVLGTGDQLGFESSYGLLIALLALPPFVNIFCSQQRCGYYSSISAFITASPLLR